MSSSDVDYLVLVNRGLLSSWRHLTAIAPLTAIATGAPDALDTLAPGGAREDFAEALAPIGERAEVERPLGMKRAQRGGGVLARGRRGERIFEFVEGEQDAHGAKGGTWIAAYRDSPQ